MCCMAPLRAPWSPIPGSHEERVMQFMWDNGLESYATSLADLHDDFYLIQAEAGPGHNHCPVVQKRLDELNDKIVAIVQQATDRYDNWRSDPLS